MRLSARLARRADLTSDAVDDMFDLMTRHYVNVDRALFEKDLSEKTWVILLSDPALDVVCGFSTQVVLRADVAGWPVRVLFSGDTIVDREYWGDSALAGTWGRLALSLIDSARDPLYWLLLSKGYKTYRFLPLFFREYHPRLGVATPRHLCRIVEAFAAARYGDDFDPECGIVRAGPWQYRLREGLADVTSERLRDPDVRFFHERNPGHARGDELCCLAPITRDNFTPAALRVIRREPELAVVS